MKQLLYTALLILLCLSAQAQTYPIVWTNPVTTTVNGDNSLTKTGVAGAWNSGIGSQNVLPSGSDGYIQFTYPGGTTNIYMVSLSRLNNDPNYMTSDYSIYVYQNSLYLFTGNTNLGLQGTLAVNDILKVSREANAIKFYKNTTVLKTITLTTNTDFLRADVSIAAGSVPVVIASFRPALVAKPQFTYPVLANNNGAIALPLEGQYNPVTYSWSSGETTSSITGKPRTTATKYTATITDAQSRTITRSYGLGYPVAWSNLTNVSVNGDNSLTKTDAAGWTAGASSLNVLPASTDGWIEFVVNEPSSSYMIGFSRIDKNADYQSINAAWYVAATGILYIFESGTSRGIFGSLQKGDVFRVAREGANINYYYNGIVKRTVAAITTPLVADVSIYDNFGPTPVISTSFDKQIRVLSSLTLPNSSNQAGSIALNIQGSYAPQTISWAPGGETSNVISNKARDTYTVTVTDAASRIFTRSYRLGYPVNWTDLANTSLNANNTVYKSIGDGNGLFDASAVSSNVLTPSTDGWIEFGQASPGARLSVGLSTSISIAANNSIDYAFHFYNDDVLIYEAGVNLGVVASQVEGNVYSIAREGTNIKYYINGIIVRTIAANVGNQYQIDSNIERGTLPFVTTSFTRTPQTFYTIANGIWTNPAIWSLSEGGAATTLYPGNTDVAVVKGYTINIASGIYTSGVNIIATNENTTLKIDGAVSLLNVKGNVTLRGENNTNTAKGLIVQNSGKLNIQAP